MNISFLIFLFFLIIKWRQNKEETLSERNQHHVPNHFDDAIEKNVISDIDYEDSLSYWNEIDEIDEIDELDELDVEQTAANNSQNLKSRKNCLPTISTDYDELDYDDFDDDTMEVDSEEVIEVERIERIGKKKLDLPIKYQEKSQMLKKVIIYKELLDKPKSLRR